MRLRCPDVGSVARPCAGGGSGNAGWPPTYLIWNNLKKRLNMSCHTFSMQASNSRPPSLSTLARPRLSPLLSYDHLFCVGDLINCKPFWDINAKPLTFNWEKQHLEDHPIFFLPFWSVPQHTWKYDHLPSYVVTFCFYPFHSPWNNSVSSGRTGVSLELRRLFCVLHTGFMCGVWSK